MASRMVGRAECPECGFQSAHVKESDKCLYRYCPECGSQHHARTERQRANLTEKMRPLDAPAASTQPTATPTGSAEPEASHAPTEGSPTATPTASKPAAPAAKRGALFF